MNECLLHLSKFPEIYNVYYDSFLLLLPSTQKCKSKLFQDDLPTFLKTEKKPLHYFGNAAKIV